MKVCRDNDPALSTIYGGASVWEINDANGGWEIGVTEPGSSGSPLFDQNGKIIGQLYAGVAGCSGTVDNNGWDVYGRFAVSWVGNGSSSSRLSDWLDPNGTGLPYLESYPAFETFDIDGGIVSIDSPENGNLSENENITITLRNFGENDISNFDISFQVNGESEVIENYSDVISATQIVQYTSLESFDFSQEGDYEIIVSIEIANDENDENNLFSSTISNIGDGNCLELYSLPYLNDFNDPVSFVNCNTFVDSDGDGNGWTSIVFDADNGNAVADSQSWDGTPLNPDNWMILGPIDMTNVNDATLSWKVRGIDPSYCGENYSVYIANSNEISSLTGSDLFYNETISSVSDACGNNFAERSLEIIGAAGQEIYVGFRHYDISDMFRLNIDDVRVEETLDLDDFSTNNINYFYNQETRELVVSSSEIIKNIQIVNLLGQKIVFENINNLTHNINLTSLSSSIYVVNIQGISGTKKFKLQIN
jgi:hypothetical protein